MRENEFEKQVQQKMGGFDLSPSEDVWKEVEQRIRKEKKRRFIFWWPLALLLVGGGIAAGIVLTNKKEKKETITVNNNTQPVAPSSPGTIPVPGPAGNFTTTTPNDVVVKKDTAVITAKQNDKTKTADEKIIMTPGYGNKPAGKKITSIKTQEINNGVKSGEKERITSNNPDKDQSQQPPLTIVAPSKQIASLPDPAKTHDIAVIKKQREEQKDQPPTTNPVTPKQHDPASDPGKADTVKVEAKQENRVQVSVQLFNDSIEKQQETSKAKKKATKWDWGISFSAGRSSVAEGLNFSNKLLYADAMAPQATTSVPVFSGSSSSLIRHSGSWSAGFFIKQPLSKKLDIKIGFGYSYLSTKMNTGNRVDSVRTIANTNSRGLSVTNFFRTGNSSSYINRYHFIGLSGDISWRILNGKKFKLDWENGLSYDRLAGSNMLHYDRSLPGYYKDNNLLRKNHLFFSTGLSLPVGERVMINPFASYSLTRVLKNADSIRTHYSNYGIRIRILLHKK